MTLAPLAGPASRRAKPGFGAPDAADATMLSGAVPSTIPSGLAPPATTQTREGMAVAPLAGPASRRAEPGSRRGKPAA